MMLLHHQHSQARISSKKKLFFKLSTNSLSVSLLLLKVKKLQSKRSFSTKLMI
jgi:hypothetical protein